MTPYEYFRAFPSAKKYADEVFVAMCFHPHFEKRYKRIIEPAIGDCGLRPYRSDSELTHGDLLARILDHIANSRLIFVDLSDANIKNVNANVAYELGIAHAIRPPQEIIVFRSTDTELPFDISHSMVPRYDPERPKVSRAKIKASLESAIKASNGLVSRLAKQVASMIDLASFHLILQCDNEGGFAVDRFEHSEHIERDRIRMFRLLDLGCIEIDTRTTVLSKSKTGRQGHLEGFYVTTPLGVEVIRVFSTLVFTNEEAACPPGD